MLSRLVAKVYSIEIVETLGKRAAQTLRRLGYKNVETKIGDGYQGWAEHAPFDKIIVTCSPENVPKPLVEQLKEGGRLVVPLGQRYQQTLYLFKKVKGVLQAEPLQPTFFVPMMGRAEEERAVQADAGRARARQRRFQERLGRSAGRLVLRPPRQGRDRRPDAGRQVPLVSQRHAGPGGAGLAGGGRRRPTDVRRSKSRLWVRGQSVQPGSLPEQHPSLAIVFFNANRQPVARHGIGPWSGTFDWVEKHRRIKVPPSARLASVEVGLWGGTGQISAGEVAIKVVAAKP